VTCRPHAARLISLAALALFAASAVPANTSANEFVPLTFEFTDAKESYAPGDGFNVTFDVANSYGNISGYYYYIKVVNVSAYFSWMGPGAWTGIDLSNTSAMLYPGEGESYSAEYQVPANLSSKNYGYKFKVIFDLWHTSWGYMGRDFTETVLYHDLSVEQLPPVNPENPDEQLDMVPILAAIVLLVAIGVAGAVMYSRSSPRGPEPAAHAAAAGTATASAASSSELPTIKSAPGERFPIERGFVYLVKEKRPGIAFAMFKEAVDHKAQGMVITREHPNRLKQTHEFEASRILWLTRRVGEDHIDPTELTRLSMTISKFIEGTKKSVVLVEGLEYLITQNDFETVLRFVNHLHDFVLAHDCAVIIVLDPRVLSTRELALLERSARVVEAGEYSIVKPERLQEEVEAN
jgi:hypothetical protein